MSSPKTQLLAAVRPAGEVLLGRDLAAAGISHPLQAHYVRTGRLVRLDRGVYRRAHEHPDWDGALRALQHHAGLPVHVGGVSALELRGIAHYVPLGDLEPGGQGPPLQVFSAPDVRLPRWFLEGAWSRTPVHRRTAFLPAGVAVSDRRTDGVVTARPERALLEALRDVPDRLEPVHARQLVENAASLDLDLVSELLRACRTAWVVRLFLVLADHADWPWSRHLDLTGARLGSGKMSVAGGGVFNRRWQLAHPPEMLDPKRT